MILYNNDILYSIVNVSNSFSHFLIFIVFDNNSSLKIVLSILGYCIFYIYILENVKYSEIFLRNPKQIGSNLSKLIQRKTSTLNPFYTGKQLRLKINIKMLFTQ